MGGDGEGGGGGWWSRWRGWVVEQVEGVGGGASGGGGWEARGRLDPLLALFRLAMSTKSASHRPKHA